MKIAKIVTHPGVFHADDVLACCLAGRLYGDLPVERRTPTAEEILDPSTLVLDIGGMCNPDRSSYDHHQRGGITLPLMDSQGPDGTRQVENGYGIKGLWNPLATAGALWLMGPDSLEVPGLTTGAEQDAFHRRMDEILFRGVDAVDCGAQQAQPGASVSLSQMIDWLNPDPLSSSEDWDWAFTRAMQVAQVALDGAIRAAVAWVQARYCSYPSERGGCCVQQVPEGPGSFRGRKALPATWAGLPEADLRTVTGVADAQFCHPGRFISGAGSLEGAIQLAELAIKA